MDKEHVKGAKDKLKGAVKEAAGKASGSDRLKAEGKVSGSGAKTSWTVA